MSELGDKKKIMKLDQLRDWLELLDLTDRTNFFSFDCIGNQEIDNKLSEYALKHGRPFNLLHYLSLPSGGWMQNF